MASFLLVADGIRYAFSSSEEFSDNRENSYGMPLGRGYYEDEGRGFSREAFVTTTNDICDFLEANHIIQDLPAGQSGNAEEAAGQSGA